MPLLSNLWILLIQFIEESKRDLSLGLISEAEYLGRLNRVESIRDEALERFQLPSNALIIDNQVEDHFVTLEYLCDVSSELMGDVVVIEPMEEMLN